MTTMTLKPLGYICTILIFTSPLVSSGIPMLTTTIDAAEISATSNFGSTLLSRARLLEENDGDENGDNDDGQQQGTTWIVDYSLKFVKCHKALHYSSGENDDGGNSGGAEVQSLVSFRLCPSKRCGFCFGGGEYIVAMEDFVDAYIDSIVSAREYQCEVVRESCYCNNDNANQDDENSNEGDENENWCENQCFANAGLDYCIEKEDENTEFDIDAYRVCTEMAVALEGNNDNNENQEYWINNQYYANAYDYINNEDLNLFIGPYCSNNGKSIKFGVFYDERCSNLAPSGTYKKYNYGRKLPYQRKSIIEQKCISCQNSVQNNDDNDDQGDSVSDMCQSLYDMSGKCEKRLKVDGHSRDMGGCDYMHNVLPKVESRRLHRRANVSAVLVWIFGLSTVGICCYSYFLRNKLYKRRRQSLASSGGTVV